MRRYQNNLTTTLPFHSHQSLHAQIYLKVLRDWMRYKTWLTDKHVFIKSPNCSKDQAEQPVLCITSKNVPDDIVLLTLFHYITPNKTVLLTPTEQKDYHYYLWSINSPIKLCCGDWTQSYAGTGINSESCKQINFLNTSADNRSWLCKNQYENGALILCGCPPWIG